MTLPMLIGHYKKEETISRLKKSYTILNQALKRSEVDNGEYENWETAFDIGAINYINKYWVPYFNVTQICLKYSDCGFTTNTPYTSLAGNAHNVNVANPNLRIPFITSDNIMYSISASTGDATVADNAVYVDINGAKGPNVYGKDLFLFTRVNNGIVPYCHALTEASINSSCSETGLGTCCSQKIMRDGWKINYKF